MRSTHKGRWCAVSHGTLSMSKLCRYTRPRLLAKWGKGTWTFLVPYASLNASFQRKTLQTTEARIVSGFGWGLTRQIENYGLARFRKNVQRVSSFTRPMVVSQVFFAVARRCYSHSRPHTSVSQATHASRFVIPQPHQRQSFHDCVSLF